MDEGEFRAFYERTARPLRAYLVASCRDRVLADDLLQEAFFRFLRSGFSSDDEAYRKNYLYRIATNLLRDHFRRRRPQAELTVTDGQAERFSGDTQLRSDVGAAMAELRPRDRQILWLAYVEGANHREIGRAVGVKAASIRSMLFRARQRLAQALGERGIGPEVMG